MAERFVYADNAATTALTDTALAAMLPYLTTAYGNPSSLYRFGQQAYGALEAARRTVAECLHAQPDEIYFTSGGTESDNWALRGTAARLAGKGKHIITTAIEHHAILHTLRYLEQQGFTVTYLPVDSQGRVTAQQVRSALRADTILVTIMAANNEIGTLEPIQEIAAVTRQAQVLFHTDAVQAVGHIPVDVQAWGVDMLSLSGHKFGAPRGVGVLYLKKPLRLGPLLYGGGQEKGLRSGTENVAGIVGLAAALQQAVGELAPETARLEALRNRLLAGLSTIAKSHVTGSLEHRLPGIASFVFECIEGESILLRLDNRGICVSTGSACSSTSLEPSHVLLAIGLPQEIAHGSVRISLGRDSTPADVDYLLEQVPQVVAELRALSPIWDGKG